MDCVNSGPNSWGAVHGPARATQTGEQAVGVNVWSEANFNFDDPFPNGRLRGTKGKATPNGVLATLQLWMQMIERVMVR